MNRQILFEDLGLKNYKEVWEYQTDLLQEIVAVKTENRQNQLQKSTQNHFLCRTSSRLYVGKKWRFEQSFAQ